MEPLFVNVSVRDEAMMKEYLRSAMFRRPIDIVLYVIVGIYLLDTIVMWFWLEYLYLGYWCILALVIFIKYFTYRRTLKLTLDRDLEANGGERVAVEVNVTDSGFVCRTKLDAPEIAFSSVKKVTQTKNLIIVITKAKLAIILTKDGFTKGTAPELLQFLRSKGLKVKGK